MTLRLLEITNSIYCRVVMTVCVCVQVSVDLGLCEEGVRACHRLLELESGHVVDAEILTVLVRAVHQELPDKATPTGK